MYLKGLEPKMQVTCFNYSDGFTECNWNGKIEDCAEVEFTTPKSSWIHKGGREGIKYMCPKCLGVVKSYNWRIS